MPSDTASIQSKQQWDAYMYIEQLRESCHYNIKNRCLSAPFFNLFSKRIITATTTTTTTTTTCTNNINDNKNDNYNHLISSIDFIIHLWTPYYTEFKAHVTILATYLREVCTVSRTLHWNNYHCNSWNQLIFHFLARWFLYNVYLFLLSASKMSEVCT